MRTERVETIVVGGGQAGLVTGYHLARRGLPFLVLDASERVGDAWRKRWDSLRLFTPRRSCGLPGLRFPGPANGYPGKDEVADYLEAYARRLRLPVRTCARVEALRADGEAFVLDAAGVRYRAAQVVVAMSNFQRPRVPAFAGQLDPGVVQLHALDYRNPAQLRPGDALVVGVGNSGGEIALELARTRRTRLAGAETGSLPLDIEGAPGRHLGTRLVRFLGHHVLSLATPVGRRVRPRLLHTAAPLIRVKPAALAAAGVERVPRVVGVRDGRPLLADGRVVDAASVVWCTGFHPGFSWIQLPVFGDDGEPLHDRGVVARAPGLYFVGLHFLYAMSSATLIGVSRDARHVARAVEARVRAAQSGRRLSFSLAGRA